MAWTSPRTWVTGETVTAALLNTHLRDNLNAIGDPGAWTAYTPTWTASTTNPTLSNGTLVGRYKQIGKTVTAAYELVWGSTTSGGTGGWRFSLPVTPSAAISTWTCAGEVSISGTRYAIFGVTSGSQLILRGPSGDATATSPAAWTSGSTLRLTITYEAA